MEARGTPSTGAESSASGAEEPGAPDGADDSGSHAPPAWAGTSGNGLRLTGGDAVRAHLTLIVGLALCSVAFWFELRRALGGNGLSWAYVFEWPLFAVFAVYMWWSVIHGGRAVRGRRAPKPKPSIDPRYAGMLEAWEAHQRELQEARAASESGHGDGGTGRPGDT
jgi:hypothetical protein